MLTKSTDADRVKQYIYNEDFRLEKERVIQEDVVQHERVFTYDTYDTYDRVTALTHQQGDYHVKTLFTLDKVGRIVKDRQQILDQNQQILWDYHTEHTYQAQGLPEQTTFAGLDPFDWHYYGSGHLFEVAQQGEPLVDWTPDRLHRQREMRFGENLIHSDYDPSGRLHTLNHAHHPQLSREHRYDQRGLLTAIQTSSGIHQYHYDPAGRLIESQMTQGIEMQQTHYQYDPAGNRIADTKAMILNNQPAEDDHCIYEYDRYGNLIKKLDKASQQQHLYDYDAMNRLQHYNRIEDSVLTTKAHYVYDVLGRRLQKKVERLQKGTREVKKEQFFYGWDGDHLVVTEKDQHRVYTLYAQGSFAPLLRIEGERQETQTSLVDHIEALIGDSLDATTKAEFDGIEKALQGEGLTTEQTAFLDKMHLSEESLRHYLPEKQQESILTTHLYANDHLGTPMALLTAEGEIKWERQQDAFGNTLTEKNDANLYQSIRFQGQHYDEESGLYYNRHRYYDPTQGKYISQDPIGLERGLNFYQYPLNPNQLIDPLGLFIPLLIGAAVILGKAALGATIDVGVQVGTQTVKQMKNNWDNGNNLLDFRKECYNIDWNSVAVSAAFGTVAPGMGEAFKKANYSRKAIQNLTSQSARTANRAAKLSGRVNKHKDIIKDVVTEQVKWQAGKAAVKCTLGQKEENPCP